MIDQLLRIKTFREKKAETEMLKNKLLLAQAKTAETEAEHVLADYVDFSNREEIRWYQDLCSRVVRLREITQVQEGVAGLKARELEYQQALAQAHKAHLDAVDVFNTSYDLYRGASIAREKFDQLLQIEMLRESKEAERKEELELEELAGQLSDRADFEEHFGA